MSALPHASGLPTPSPSRSGAGIKKGVFPPRPKSVRVLAVLDPATNPSQPEPAASTSSKQFGQADSSVAPEDKFVAKYRVSVWAVWGLLGVFAAAALAVLRGNYLGK